MSRVFNRRRGQKGFTLIELLIVVAIIGIIAAILIPNLLDALQKAKQKRTMGDIRNIGTAWFSWFQDQVSAAAAGASDGQYDFAVRPRCSNGPRRLQALLYQQRPCSTSRRSRTRTVGATTTSSRWRNHWHPRSWASAAVVAMAHSTAAPTPWDRLSPLTTMQDIVWADGFFVRYPAGAQVLDDAPATP